MGFSAEHKEAVATNLVVSRQCPVCAQSFDAQSRVERCPADGSLLAPIKIDSLVGTIIDGKYTIEKLLSTGGWSRVYLAKQESLNRQVAVKVLHEHLAACPDRVKRLEQEARAAGQLSCPQVVGLYDFGKLSDGRPYLVMEYVDGADLSEPIQKTGGDWTVETLVSLWRDVLAGLAAAHAAGLVHRDIKPSNILTFKDESGKLRAKLTDFGIATIADGDRDNTSLTMTSEVLGTLDFMSPEQCRGDDLDVRSDIYSLGCVFYQMLSGKAPFRGASVFEVLQKHQNEEAPPLPESVPPGLKAVIGKCLQKDRGDRYGDCAALLADLDLFVAGGTIKQHQRSKPSGTSVRSLVFLLLASFLAIAGIMFAKAYPDKVPYLWEIQSYFEDQERAREFEVRSPEALLYGQFKEMERSIGLEMQQGHAARARELTALLQKYRDLLATHQPPDGGPITSVVAVSEAGQKLPDGRAVARVHVSETSRPVNLVLCSRTALTWQIECDKGVKLDSISCGGLSPQVVAGAPAGVPVAQYFVNKDEDIVDKSSSDAPSRYSWVCFPDHSFVPAYDNFCQRYYKHFGSHPDVLRSYYAYFGKPAEVGWSDYQWRCAYVGQLMQKDFENVVRAQRADDLAKLEKVRFAAVLQSSYYLPSVCVMTLAKPEKLLVDDAEMATPERVSFDLSGNRGALACVGKLFWIEDGKMKTVPVTRDIPGLDMHTGMALDTKRNEVFLAAGTVGNHLLVRWSAASGQWKVVTRLSRASEMIEGPEALAYSSSQDCLYRFMSKGERAPLVKITKLSPTTGETVGELALSKPLVVQVPDMFCADHYLFITDGFDSRKTPLVVVDTNDGRVMYEGNLPRLHRPAPWDNQPKEAQEPLRWLTESEEKELQ